VEKAFVLPGELVFAKEPTYVSTVLGSCVAVCMFDASKKMGGMNHFVVPESRPGEMEGTRVAEAAIKALLKQFLIAGSKISSLKAEIYGGAKVVTAFNTIADIGDRNVLKARQVLTELKVIYNLRDVGGIQGKKLIFDTSTGRVNCTAIEKTLENYSNNKAGVKPANDNLPGVMIVDDSPTVREIVRGAIYRSKWKT
jgi:chemotaxis receptor (MCP) glutamine deamidase CheD